MSPKTLKAGAILIADAHCAPWRTPFIDFLRALDSGEIVTPQLILMGDVLDMLYGPIPATYHFNTEVIELLNRLSERIEIIYLEGNHDFLLQQIFEKIYVVRREQQPFGMKYGTQKIALSHGDTQTGKGYELYTWLIRNRGLLPVLRVIDKLGHGFIVRWLEKLMRSKVHCRTIENFKQIITRRLAQMNLSEFTVLIEGHFHQNKSFGYKDLTYINLGAFACNERYFTVQSNQDQFTLGEAVFRKEPL